MAIGDVGVPGEVFNYIFMSDKMMAYLFMYGKMMMSSSSVSASRVPRYRRTKATSFIL